MSGTHAYQSEFISIIRYGDLERILKKPEDIALLFELIPKDYLYSDDTRYPDPSLQAIWGFAMVKGGMSIHDFYSRATSLTSESGINPAQTFPCLAFQELNALLQKQQDKTLLHDLYFRRSGHADRYLLAIWDFAIAKGQESTLERSSEISITARQTIPARNSRVNFLGWYNGLVSLLRR